jgi:hypothetical protein
MRMLPSDPDIETLVRRIDAGQLDLQPDFQRGEVWSEAKRQRLIDSLLRGWHIPPIHVLSVPGQARHEVLDGQQRLAAIRDFVHDRIRIDGRIQPFDEKIAGLNALRFSQLPEDARLGFLASTIRQFMLVDYTPGEPAELFFRLNQPTSLTGAEQRNAFYGAPRSQVRGLVEKLGKSGVDKAFIGFSNSRMAYDDVLARLCVAAERENILQKITAGDLAERYRSNRPFSEQALARSERAAQMLADVRPHVKHAVHLNKATLFSWLWFFLTGDAWDIRLEDHTLVANYFGFFELAQSSGRIDELRAQVPGKTDNHLLFELLALYRDRASARVADVTSVVGRDIALWGVFALVEGKARPELLARERAKDVWDLVAVLKEWEGPIEALVEKSVIDKSWGHI